MRTTRAVCAAASFCLCVGLASTAAAQQPPADAAAAQALRAEIDQLRADFTARLTALEAKLASLTGQPPGTEALNAVLAGDRRVVAVTKFGEGPSTGVRPPPVLAGTDQVGFNDILVDPGGVVRRGLLFLDDGASVIPSFALQLALRYLEPEGIVPTPDPGDEALLRLGRTTIRPLEPNDGGYVRADARGYQFLLDYHGAPRFFTSIELTALLDGGAPSDLMRGKINLFGLDALVNMATAAGFHIEMRVLDAA